MSTPSVQTSYANGSGNTVRLASRTYPDGRVVSVDYGTAGETDDLIGRVAALVDDDDTTLAEYQYLGLGAVVQQDSPEADLRFTLVNPSGTNDPDTGDIYSGLDRFGRVKDVRWRDVSADSDLSRVQYGYDRASNRTFRRNASDTANHHDWLYGYDGLHRLQDAQRGTLNGGHTAITSPEFAQCWTLDPTGNWQGFRQADSGDPWDLVQARLANPVNEITGITNSTGPAWAQPAYDGAGNMTTIPQPADPTEAYTATYDAWNRLVQLVDPATDHTVQENEYDGRGFRIVRKSYTAGVLTETRHFYYTDGWRDVEERLGTNPDTADPDRQFVWGLRYIDDLVLRDRSDAGTLDERLYALQDANWNVTAVVDDAGSVQERYEHDPYGQLTVLSPGFVVRAGSSFGWETTYAGYRFDAATGLTHVRYRFLSSYFGWLQRDPIGYADWLALMVYVGSMPLDVIDPLGLQGGFSRPVQTPIVRPINPPAWPTNPVPPTGGPGRNSPSWSSGGRGNPGNGSGTWRPPDYQFIPTHSTDIDSQLRRNRYLPPPLPYGCPSRPPHPTTSPQIAPEPGTPAWEEFTFQEWQQYLASGGPLLPTPSNPSFNPLLIPPQLLTGSQSGAPGGPPLPPRARYYLPSPQEGCNPCVPPVGSVAYQLHTTHTHAGMAQHYHYFVMNQSPLPLCQCFWDRNATPPTDATTAGPYSGTVPITPASGGGPV